MDLETYLENHSYLRAFRSETDQKSVLDLAAKSPMQVGGMELLYDRSPDYQALLTCQGSKQMTILAEDREVLLFVYSFTAAKKWIHGNLVDCAYIGDFRTNQSRKAARVWRKYYAEFLSVLKKDEGFSTPKYILTAILKKNAMAVRNLVQTKKDLGFRYDFLAELNMVNVFGRWPWLRPSPILTTQATAQDADALKVFLLKSEKEKIFGSNFDGSFRDDWSWRKENWPGFAVENFLIQKNQSGEIFACTLPWDPGFAKRMTVTKAPASISLVFKFLNWFGFSMPQEGASLKTLYLTHLNISSELHEVYSISSFLQFVASHKKGYHMISFADQKGLAKGLKGFILQKVPVLLFTVALSGEASLEKADQQVSFEMGLV